MQERILPRPKQIENQMLLEDRDELLKEIFRAETAQDAAEIYHVIYPKEPSTRKRIAHAPAHPKLRRKNLRPQNCKK